MAVKNRLSSIEGKRQFRQSAIAHELRGESVSVLIPARNEERNIRGAIAAVLANRDLNLELVVLDDHSTDGTAKIVSEISTTKSAGYIWKVRPFFPAGWCGKQHACAVLAQHALAPLTLSF